jgi:hypothetical protein
MVHMATRKIACIILALMFGLSLFASGAFARVTCDGERCKHHVMNRAQLTARANLTLEDRDCCTGSQNEPCDLQSGRALELHDCTLSFARADKSDPSDVYIIGSDQVPEAFSLMASGTLLKDRPVVPSSPIYLRKVSLIC